MKNLLAQDTPQFEYVIKKSSRARRLRISIHTNGQVVITIPRYLNESFAWKFVENKQDWIKSKVDYINSLRLKKNIFRFPPYKTSREEARKIITKMVYEMNQYYGYKFGRIAIKNQKTCWGSCSRRGNLNFNYKVAYLPEKMANYIVVHELCHLKQLNHSYKFWDLVSQVFPDYKRIHKEMKEKGYNLS